MAAMSAGGAARWWPSRFGADGVRDFALILTHPKLRGASGAWTSPIALV